MTSGNVKGVKGGVKGTLHAGELGPVRVCALCEGCEGSFHNYYACAGARERFPCESDS